jgi:hypothetical protein
MNCKQVRATIPNEDSQRFNAGVCEGIVDH